MIEADWIAPGAYVTTLGPKQVGRAEFGPDLVARADVAVTDSVAQSSAYDPPFILGRDSAARPADQPGCRARR